MKLDQRGKLILKYLHEHGDQLGAALCQHFNISEQVLFNTMAPLRKSHQVAVDKVQRPGERGGSYNRFRLVGSDDASDGKMSVVHAKPMDCDVPQIIGGFNPADPFNMAQHRTEQSAAPVDPGQHVTLKLSKQAIAELRRALLVIDDPDGHHE